MPKTSTLLVACVLILVALGIVMVDSASGEQGMSRYHNAHHYVELQAVWLFIGLCGAFICYKRDYRLLQKYAIAIGVITLILLVAVRIPGIGRRVNGSWRWLRLGPLSLQPSELAKLGTLICLASWMTFVEDKKSILEHKLFRPLIGLGLAAGLVLVEPDFGTTLLLGISGMAVIYAGGAPAWWLVGCGGVGFAGMVALVLHDDVRRERILAFLDPAAHPTAAFHLIQSKTAFIRGHWFGVGLGNSIQKHKYLPEAHTDFILPILGEEMGFVAAVSVLLLFVVIMFCGLLISLRANDRFGKLLAFGITTLITTQAAINIAVVTGAMPTKGLPLPFLSYGGSSLMVSLTFIGVLLSIARQVPPDDPNDGHVIKNKARRL